MTYYYENDGRTCALTLTHAAPEWVNLDCPDLYNSEHDLILHSSMAGLVYYNDNLAEFKRLMKFIKASDVAFEKKYPQCANDLGLVRNFIRSNPDWIAQAI